MASNTTAQISLHTSDFRIRLRNVLKNGKLTWNSEPRGGLNREHLEQYAISNNMKVSKKMLKGELIKLIKAHNKIIHDDNIYNVFAKKELARMIGSYDNKKLTSTQEANLRYGPSPLFNRPHTGPMGPVNKMFSKQIHSKWHQVILDDEFENIDYMELFQKKESESWSQYTKRVKISAWALINHRIDIFIRIIKQDEYGTSSTNATATNQTMSLPPHLRRRIMPHVITDDIRFMKRAMELVKSMSDASLVFTVASDNLKKSREFQKHSIVTQRINIIEYIGNYKHGADIFNSADEGRFLSTVDENIINEDHRTNMMQIYHHPHALQYYNVLGSPEEDIRVIQLALIRDPTAVTYIQDILNHMNSEQVYGTPGIPSERNAEIIKMIQDANRSLSKLKQIDINDIIPILKQGNAIHDHWDADNRLASPDSSW